MPGGTLLGGLLAEMRLVPFTVTVVLALTVATLTGWIFILPRMAQSAELKQVTDTLTAQLASTSEELKDFKAELVLQRKQDQLRSLQQELFSVQREEERMKATGERVPELYALQIARLHRDIGTMEREIAVFLAAHPELLE